MGSDDYGTSYESFYNGGISSLDSNYGSDNGSFTGARMYASNLGFPGSTQTANQLNEAVNAIKQGVKSFEVTMGQSATAEQIPIQHFEEMRALMKLSGVKPTVHAPFDMDPSGFAGQQGYSDEAREENQRRFFQTLEKAAVLNKGNGNTPVVFHSSGGLPGVQYKRGENGEMVPFKGALINQETGQMMPIEEEKKFYLDHPEDFSGGGTAHKLMEEVSSANASLWRQKMTEVANYKKMTDEVLGNATAFLAEYNKMKNEDFDPKTMTEEQRAYFQRMKDAQTFLQNTHLSFNSAFDMAYRYGTNEQKGALKKIAEEYKEDVGKNDEKNPIWRYLSEKGALDEAIHKLDSITTNGKPIKDPYTGEQIRPVPQLLKPIEDFAREKAAETFGNLAWKSYQKLGGENAPTLAVENMFAGEWAHSTAEGMKKLIEDSRKKFIENAKEEMGEKEAERVAEKLIGVTWDVGHLNMIKKHGFSDKEVVKMSEQIAPYVKHIHLTDNFGYSDSHLAPGMGNVPIKQILEKLEKGGVDLRQVTKTVEAPGFVQHFRKSPHGWTMAALGSPIYGAMMGPYWNQVAGATAGGGYFGFPYAHLPDKHFSTYGSGFSNLPEELGGQMPGTASRFSGTSNA